ncbi:cyclin-dependent kinase 11B isoform X2 [Solenopsis invicta]|uniref:cyclin-dependent kinase 11B isoform X2 n=1 Tax=Solenopsis invicta TaxID=13686 RepID=UPI000595D8F2|nr:cyclin-dependent kinase 11B isoform X2 [Solenopsis invicta]
MSTDASDMDIDNQSEDGEIKKSPSKDMDFSFSEEEGGDTADSLDIKPPQAIVRHHKSSSSHRSEKHSDRRNRRDEKERKSRQHEDRREDRHRNKHRHRRHVGEPLERPERLESSKRNRERMERLDRMESHPRDRESSRHDRKERNTGDRVLEDLRERLLDKRRERREDPRDSRYKIESSRHEVRLDDLREIRESRDRREIRMEDLRDRREMRIADDNRERREIRIETHEQRHIRLIMDEQFSESELMERSEKRRKRSHKHDRVRERDQEKMEREKEHREKQLRNAMEIVADEINEMDVQNEISIQIKDPKEMTEQELRKERLLEADREMARRKEVSRMELEARRMKRGEKRPMSPNNNPDPSIVELSDESISPHSEGARSKSAESRHSSEVERSPHERSSERHSSDSSESSSADDDESNESNKGSAGDSNDGSEYNNPSPLSVDRLAKSDHSDGDSPGHVDSNNASKNIEEEKKAEEPELPPYLPAIQGCRSVEEFQCLNRIEEGTYGVVYRARDKRTDEIVALKRLKMEKEKEGFPITSLREINTLLKAQHPNIVTVREIVVGSNMDKIFIVMDYVEHDLKSLIETMKQKKQVFIPGEVKCLMQQLLRAVAHLHDNWILHRDLKTSNLLLSHRGILKVGDFGLAREYGSPLRQYTPIVVTLWYRAPELLLCDKEYAGLYSTPIDMWSVGCIFAELLRMEPLFPGKSDIDQLNKIFKELGTPSDRIWPGYSKLPIVQKIPFAHYPVNNLRQRFSLSLSDLGIELLNKFLTYDPRQRVTAEKALDHDYFIEAPKPIDPQMFPTWPAKSEQGSRTTNASPKPPSGGREYKQLGDGDDADFSNSGFHMGLTEGGRAPPVGGGFHLKF